MYNIKFIYSINLFINLLLKIRGKILKSVVVSKDKIVQNHNISNEK